MAKNQKITLTLDFEVEKGKLQEVSNLISKDLGKGLKGNRANDYFSNLKSSVANASKEINAMYSALSKPLISKNQAKELSTNIQSAFKGLDQQLLSLQGNIGKTFNAASNVAALKQIRQLGNELDQLTADYQKISQLLSQSKSLGNKSSLKSIISGATKELDVLSKKQGTLTKQEQVRQKELTTEIQKANTALEEKLRLSERINAIQTANGVTSQGQLSSIISNKVTEQQELINGSLAVSDANTLKNTLSQIRDIVKDIMHTSNATVDKTVDNFDTVVQNEKKMEEQAKSFKSVLRDLGIPMLTLHELASTFKQVVSYSFDYIKNLDKALTEISIVSGKTRKEVLGLTGTFIELSAKTGMAIDDIAQASTIFYQQGLGDAAVKQLTEYTAIFAKISNETVETAADQITAAINGFNMQASQAEDVIDKLSVLAAYSAADIDELATAMSKAASQANMAGLSFDEYNAYLATMIETTREAPENIGTSLKTIMSRFQSIKTGENTDDDTDVNDVETALKSVGIQLRDSEGQLRDLGEVLTELGPKWNSLSRNTQAYLGTVVAGTRQQSRFISLMQNWDRALELTTASENSAGAAAKMHKSAMKGLDASINSLTNAWQKLISSIANGDSFKWIIDTATGLLKWLSDGNALLKVVTTSILLFNTKSLITRVTLASVGKEFKNTDEKVLSLGLQLKKVTKAFNDTVNPMSKTTANLEAYRRKIEETTSALRENTTAKRENAASINGGGTSAEGSPTLLTKTKDVPTAALNATPMTEGAKSVTKSAGTAGGALKKLGTKVSTFANNAVSALGTIQTAISVASIIYLAGTQLEDWLVTTGDEMMEEAQATFDSLQEEIDKHNENIQSIESNLKVYDKLSKKMSKSTEEVNQLAEAAEALAKASPGSLIGYDSEGNAIIDVSSAKATLKQEKEELVEASKEQIGNLGNLAIADMRKQAEDNYKSSSTGKTTSTTKAVGVGATTIGGGLLAASLAADSTVVGIPVGIALKIAAGLVTVGGLLWAGSTVVEKNNISQEQLRIAVEKSSEIQEKYQADLLKNMSVITNNSVRPHTVEGTSEEERETMAAYMGQSWLNKKTGDLTDKLASKEIDEKEFERQYKKLGDDWEDFLDGLGEKGIAKVTKAVNKIAEDIGDKSYKSVEEAIEKIVTDDLGISKDDQLFNTIKESLIDAAYSGLGTSINDIVKDLEKRKGKANQSKEVQDIYNTAITNTKNMSSNEAAFYDKIGITEDVSLYNMVVSQYGEQIMMALKKSTEEGVAESIVILEGYKNAAQQHLQGLAKEVGVDSVDEIDYDKLTRKQKDTYDKWVGLAESAKNSIEDAWNSLDISSDIPWENLWNNLEELTKRAKTANETLISITNGDGIDISDWKDFTTLFDKIDFDSLDASQIDQYSNALNSMAGNLEVVNGKIYTSKDAIATVTDMERQAIEVSIEATRQELLNKQMEIEAQKAIIDAQIATLEYKIAEAEGSKDAEDLKIKAQDSWLNASNKTNQFFISNEDKVSEAMVKSFSSGFGEILTKYNKMITAMANGEVNQDTINDLKSSIKEIKTDLTFDNYNSELGKYDTTELNKQLAAAKKASSTYNNQIANINLKLKTPDLGLYTTKDGVGGMDKSDEAEAYAGKLLKIYNILNRISSLEGRLNLFEAFGDIATGEKYAKALSTQLDYSRELTNQYAFLTEERTKEANAYQDFIKNGVEGLEGVFSFDDFGQIIIDWEKYNALQDVSIDGETTLKEKADDVYDTYTQMFDDRISSAKEYISFLEKTISLEKKQIDAYTEMEEKAASAIKEIYQKILDTKLDAIDQEKEALEELREAREKARKDQENAKEISGLQTDIQRAMMDTSGASDSALIKAQQDMNDKLEEIADDKYSEELDNIINRLDEEKDTLQEQFDELFDNQAWLYDNLDKNFMKNYDELEKLFTQTEEWNQASPLRQKQLVDEWSTSYHTYMDALQNGKSIADLYTQMIEEQNKITVLQNSLSSKLETEGGKISATIREWQTATNKAITSSSGSGGSSYTGSIGGAGSNSKKTTIQDTGSNVTPDVGKYKNSNSSGSKYKSGDKLKTKEAWGFVTSYQFDDKGNLIGSRQSGLMFNKRANFIVDGDPILYKGQYYYKVKDTSSSWVVPNGYWMKGLQLDKYAAGGFADFTGPAWLDGTKQKPEAVLTALQTEHFIQFTDAIDKIAAGGVSTTSTGTVNIDNIQFNVESMSSPEDGEAAFNAFVNKFKEIGNQTGIKVNTFKNTL